MNNRQVDLAAVAAELDRRLSAEDSLYEFLKQAWHVIEPSEEFVDNWHIQVVCLPYEARIITDEGMRSIGSLVESQWNGRVLSFCHETQKPEWRSIRAHMKSPPQSGVAISVDGGDGLRVTGNHPVFVKGRGYVRADEVEVGDTLLRAVSRAVGSSGKLSDPVLLPALRLRSYEGSVSGAQRTFMQAVRQCVFSLSVAARRVLRDALLWPFQSEARESCMPDVRRPESVGWSWVPSLHGGGKSHGRDAALSLLRETCLPLARYVGSYIANSWRVLQSRMLRKIHGGAEQSCLHRWLKSSHLSGRVWAHAQADSAPGRASLLPLFRGRAAGCASHRQGPRQQCSVESRGALSAMPCETKGRDASGNYQIIECHVSEVRRQIRLSEAVYNIEVEQNRNYFAEGVLVHNCEHLEEVSAGRARNVLINFPPRMLKPVDVAAKVLTGRGLIPLGEVEVGDVVWTHVARWRPVTEVLRQGILPTLRVETANGRSVAATHDHLFFTPEGWRPLGEMKPDDVLGVSSLSLEGGLPVVSREEARLLGYVIGDGSCLYGTTSITCGDDEETADIIRCAESLGFIPKEVRYRTQKKGGWLRRILLNGKHGPGRGTKGYLGPVRQWLQRFGLERKSSYTKRVPDQLFVANEEIIREFLGAYWSCDGHITIRGKTKDGTERRDLYIGCDSVSRELLEGLQLLLLRLGIRASLRRKRVKLKTKRQGEFYTSYCLSIASQDDCWRFAQKIRPYHAKVGKFAEAYARRFDFDRPHVGETISSIAPGGDRECVCLRVEEDHSFTANGFIVHNTIICAVAWPAWEWIHRPGTKFVFASYSWSLAEDASIRCRSLIKSEWYRVRWGDRYSLLEDRDKKDLFGNTKGGERIITSPDATITGRGGHIIVADDPNHTKDKSDTVLNSTRDWWKNVMPSRLNNQKTGRRVVVQQRIDERDISGYILSTNRKAWVHVRLPNEYEEKSPCKTIPLKSTNGKPWRDPRLHEGDLLFPEFLPKAESKSLRNELGEYGYAGQYQQRPAPAEGGIIKKGWFQPWKQAKRPENMEWIIQSWDTAMTERKMGAYSCCQTYGVFKTDKGLPALLLLSRFRARVEYPELRKVAMMLAEDYMDDDILRPRTKRNPKNKPDMILIEDKSSGKTLIADMARAGVFATRFNPDRYGDKIGRVKLITHLLEGGIVYVPYAPPSFERPLNWVDQYLLSMGTFPNADSRDDVDTLTQVLLRLINSGWVFHPTDEAAKPKKKFADEHREAIY